MHGLRRLFYCGLFVVCLAACYSAAVPSVHAALMDGKKDLIARYGKGYRESHPDHAHLIVPAEQTMLWQDLPDYEVYVHMLADLSQCEVFTLKRAITSRDDQVLKKILADNANGDQWVPMPEEMLPAYNSLQSEKGEPEYKYVWKQNKGTRRAVVLKKEPSKVEISTEGWRRAKQRSKE